MGGLTENRLTTKYFSSSISYYEDSLTWCVARARPIPRWQNVFCIMKDRELWAYAVVTFYASVYLFYFLGRFEDRIYDSYMVTLSALCLMLNTSAPYPMTRNTARAFLVVCSLACTMNIIIFNAFLINIQISIIYEMQVDSVEELVADFELVGDRAALSLLTHQSEVID